MYSDFRPVYKRRQRPRVGQLIMRMLKGGELGHFILPTRRIPACMSPYAPSLQPEDLPMAHIEDAIVEKLRTGGHCCLDDVVTHLSPIYSWSEIFIAVDRMSRNGGVLIRQLGYSTFQIALPPEGVSPIQRRVTDGENASQSLDC